MQVQEFTDLANWFKANVLELSGDDDDGFYEVGVTDNDSDALEATETVPAQTDDDPEEHTMYDNSDDDEDIIVFTEVSIEESRRQHQQDELSLFEFIVGIDRM